VEGIGFAIPSNTARLVARQLVEKGGVARPDLGVNHRQISPALASLYGFPVRHGAFVLQVNPNGPGAQAGIKEGDIIVRIGDDPVDDEHPFVNVLIKHEPGEKVTVTFNRGGQEMKVDVVLTERQ
jgi:S1-C subfamily serine protease